jgi:uncharacterized membrane protein
MTRRGFLRRLDVPAVEAAIHRAERDTSGEIRVAIAGLFWGSPRRLGDRAFRRLRMEATRHRNGVLILVAPARRKLLVVGDQGIHARVGDAFWGALSDAVGAKLRAGDFTRGLVEAVEIVGRELARHFPVEPGGGIDELPDTVDLG